MTVQTGRTPFGYPNRAICSAYAWRRLRGMMTLPEAARSLGVKPSTLRHQIALGRLAATKIARDWLLEPAEVERYRAEHLRKAVA